MHERPLAGAPACARRAQGRGRGRRARAGAGGARRAGGAARCSHDGRGCVRSGQSRGRLRPLHPGATATHHPARRVLGKDTARRGAGHGRDLTWPGRPCGHKRVGAPATEFLSPVAETSKSCRCFHSSGSVRVRPRGRSPKFKAAYWGARIRAWIFF